MVKRKEGKWKSQNFLRIVVALVMMVSVVAGVVKAEIDVGFGIGSNEEKVVIELPEEEVNYSLVNVNNSLYWAGNEWSDTRWLNVDGSNANTNIDINGYNLTAGYIIADGSRLYNVNFSGYYPHDQNLNTTDSVSFVKVNADNYTGTYLNVTNGTFKYLNVTENLYVKNSTIYLGNVSMSSFVDGDGKKIITFGDTFVNASGYFGDGGFLDNISFVNGTVIAIAFNGTEFSGGNFTGDNFTVNGGITLNNTTITDWSVFEVQEYNEIVKVNVVGGNGQNQTREVIEFEVDKVEVVPPSSTARYYFEAVEDNGADYVDKSFRRHRGNWTVYPSLAVNDKINFSVSGATVDGEYIVKIKYLDNFRNL